MVAIMPHPKTLRTWCPVTPWRASSSSGTLSSWCLCPWLILVFESGGRVIYASPNELPHQVQTALPGSQCSKGTGLRVRVVVGGMALRKRGGP